MNPLDDYTLRYETFKVNELFTHPSRTSIGIRFSEIIHDDTSYSSNIVGLAIFLVYASIYLYYVPANERRSYYVKIFGAVVFIVLVLVYSKVQYVSNNSK